MFDIGFWELLLIGVVGLLVIGPERLPTVATLAGQWVGRLRRFARHMRSEIQEELESEHLKQVLDQQNREMESLRREVGDARREAGDLMNESVESIDRPTQSKPTPASAGAEAPAGDRDKDD